MSGRYAAETKEGFQPMTDTLTVRTVPDNPAATVVEHNGIPIVYVYPTAWDDKWAWVAGRRESWLLDTEAEAWQQIRESPDLFTDDPVMARQLVAICRREQALADLARISQELGLYDIEE